jgi:hypothetical protein
MSATVKPLARSAMMRVRLYPNLSTKVPPRKPASTTGKTVKKPVIPVWVALPVVWSTNQGIAIAESTLPTNEIALAVSREMIGVLFSGNLLLQLLPHDRGSPAVMLYLFDDFPSQPFI